MKPALILIAPIAACALLASAASGQTPPQPDQSAPAAPAAPAAAAAPDAAAASPSSPATAAADPALIKRGQAVFAERCKDCHEPPAGDAPSRADLAMRKPDEVFDILKTGLMQPMAAGLSDDDMRAAAAFVTTPVTTP